SAPVEIPIQAQILPVRIGRFDQGQLLGAAPCLGFLLALDGARNVTSFLEVHQAVERVLAVEAGKECVPVFVDTPAEVVGNANVGGEGAARHDVDVVAFHASLRQSGRIASR